MQEEVLEDSPDRPFVSVIVPVFNDAVRLKSCLQALHDQTYPGHRYEVVVVDNGSEDTIDAVVAEFQGVRKVDERRPGSYAARNRGIESSKGDVIAFTDADCMPRPDWIEKGISHLDSASRKRVVGGKMELFPRDRRRATAVELYELATALKQDDYVERGGFAATANLFAFRSLFEEIGGFDDTVKSCGDVEWGQRAASAGHRVVYADDVRVRHPARSTLRQLRKKVVRIIGGVHDLRQRKACRFLGIDRNLLSDWVPPVRYSLTALRNPVLETLWERVRVIGIMFLVRYMEAWERLRLKCGGKSRR